MSPSRFHPALPDSFRPWLERCPVLTTIGNTPLVRLHLDGADKPGVEVWAKLEYFNPGGSIKDRPVLWMLLSAIRDGTLRPGMTLAAVLAFERSRTHAGTSG